jgi:SAM-dependent methyltransferase
MEADLHPTGLDRQGAGIEGFAMSSAPVRDYYEHNTRHFLRFGTGQTIHRGLWGEGVQTPEQAAHWVHGELLALLQRQHGPGPVRWLDLGCGVGTSCRWLASRRAGTGTGLSISPTQVELAQRYAQEQGLADRCTFGIADFCVLPEDLGPFELAYAIEAYVHAAEPSALLHGAARRLVPGGLLVVVDDFLAPGISPEDPVVARFRSGWHTPALDTADSVVARAAQAGLRLVEDRDLTSLVRLGRPRDHLVSWLQPLLRLGAPYSPWFQSLVGGDALQQGLGSGKLQHRWLLFST